ncbi:MAG: homoserine kinase [Actinobacteria bacterium]|nr:homoserine kinase [Actinomycetota bacterium]MCL6095250.1 homoserine kinase [Actinomycetota bacterium]
MRARAPASSANLGPGFDTLALALELYVEVEVSPAPHLTVRTEGEGEELPADKSHLAAQVAIGVLGHDKVSITVKSDIPVARGLGSSAALAAATAAAAGAADPLAIAASIDGHPENAAATVLGGLVAATMVRGSVKAVRLPLDDQLVFVTVVPDRQLATTKARRVLPTHVHLADAAFNLGRMGILLGGLADKGQLSKEATEDRIHQDFRSPLFPEAPQLLARLLEAGSIASCWSGAGTTMLGICEAVRGKHVADAMRAGLDDMGLTGRVFLLRADRKGLEIISSDNSF